ncbi:outer membrane protein assembly factor [Granulicella arctica]|uniref:POTRA domain-containing protein n=1 Tax=Granulicella arctica TaxID=940613 RepID=UPI0021E0B03E|nr:outer membrane protein assembly factor [Granulicella arctica]
MSIAAGQGIPAPSSPGPVAPGGRPDLVPNASTQAPVRQAEPGDAQNTAATQDAPAVPSLAATIWQFKGLHVDAIRFEGVTFDPGDTLPNELAQKAGEPLDPQKVRLSLRRLFKSGRYRDIDVRSLRQGDSVTLVFGGTPRYYVGRVVIQGVKEERLASLLEFGTKLDPGTAFSEEMIDAGVEGIKQVLQQNGFFQPTVVAVSTIDAANQQVDATYTVNIGPQARIGQVTLQGSDPGLTEAEFRKKGKLKRKAKVTRDTTSNALTKLRAEYQKKDRLEATAALTKSTYDPTRRQIDYQFTASQGPLVKVITEGAKFSKSRLHLLVPVFEEGTIDNDLLNEGTHNIKDYLQQQGFFDVTVEVKVIGGGTPNEQVVYSVNKGTKHKVMAVTLNGNKYFNNDTLRERMRVQKADAYMPAGRFSPSLLTADGNSIQSLYRANGFNEAKVTSKIEDIDEGPQGKPLKVAVIKVALTIVEGPQQKFGVIKLTGVDPTRMKAVTPLLNAQEGQPFSLITLSGDRDEVLSYYVSNGFDQARIEIKQQKEGADPTRTDVTLNVTEGQQIFINHVLLSGVIRTKPKVVQDQLRVHPGDPLDESALLQTQRNLYNLALFNEVVAAPQNPAGAAPEKNVLVQVTEAKRWDVTYGFGFEAQTGTPTQGKISPASLILLCGANPTPACSGAGQQDGSAGVSPRVSLDVSRINLRGTDESLTLHTTYGLLEKVATLSFQNPHFLGHPPLNFSLSGGYSNVQNITTFQASTLQGDVRLTQKVRKTDTFIYDFQYRRVSVNPATLQVSSNLIPQLSQPVRVGGPGITWFHDTRQPSPLDATKGSYTSVQEFIASSKFGSQTDFNRLDITNSTYYQFGKKKYVLARNTRLGFENSFGVNPNISSDPTSACFGILLATNASCNPVPLPERLYAGGATSHRGFGINDAGPRDLQTGFPVGGSAALINTVELRLPPPTLPVVGDSVSFVVFHDMGNAFNHIGDMFPSVLRYHQPNQQTCANVSGTPGQTNTVGTCDFNYFSHALGLGARYKTPVGPIRVDFSYNLNPPVYPVIFDFNGSNPYEGKAGHFNFFFSIGQSF